MKMQHKLLWTIGPSNIILVYTMDTKDMQTEPQENSYLCPQYTLEKKTKQRTVSCLTTIWFDLWPQTTAFQGQKPMLRSSGAKKSW